MQTRLACVSVLLSLIVSTPSKAGLVTSVDIWGAGLGASTAASRTPNSADFSVWVDPTCGTGSGVLVHHHCENAKLQIDTTVSFSTGGPIYIGFDIAPDNSNENVVLLDTRFSNQSGSAFSTFGIELGYINEIGFFAFAQDNFSSPTYSNYYFDSYGFPESNPFTSSFWVGGNRNQTAWYGNGLGNGEQARFISILATPDVLLDAANLVYPLAMRLQPNAEFVLPPQASDVLEPPTVALVGMALLSLFGFSLLRHRAEVIA